MFLLSKETVTLVTRYHGVKCFKNVRYTLPGRRERKSSKPTPLVEMAAVEAVAATYDPRENGGDDGQVKRIKCHLLNKMRGAFDCLYEGAQGFETDKDTKIDEMVPPRAKMMWFQVVFVHSFKGGTVAGTQPRPR